MIPSLEYKIFLNFIMGTHRGLAFFNTLLLVQRRSSIMSRRGVWQLQRIAFNYCEHSGSSRGAREFIKHSSNSSSGYMTSFMEDNPQIDVTMTVRPGRHPWIEATYLNGRVRSVSMRNDDPVEILRQMMNLRSSVGRKTTCGRKSNRQIKERVVTQQPSIQGRWTPALATALANGK